MKKETTKVFYYIVVLISLFFFQLASSKIAGMIANGFDYHAFDPNQVFMSISVHHILQMIIALIAMYFISLKFHVNFHLKVVPSNSGIQYTIVFSIVMLLYVLITYFIGYKAGTIQPYTYPFTPLNVIGTLGFQLLLSGRSEALLFRALPIALLLNMSKRDEQNKCHDDFGNLVIFYLVFLSTNQMES